MEPWRFTSLFSFAFTTLNWLPSMATRFSSSRSIARHRATTVGKPCRSRAYCLFGNLQSARQPNESQVAAALPFQPSWRLDLIDVAVRKKFAVSARNDSQADPSEHAWHGILPPINSAGRSGINHSNRTVVAKIIVWLRSIPSINCAIKDFHTECGNHTIIQIKGEFAHSLSAPRSMILAAASDRFRVMY